MRLKGTTQKLHHAVLTVLLLSVALPFDAKSQTDITSLSSISSDPTGHYRLTANITSVSTTIAGTFTGTLEAAIDPATNMPFRIETLTAPLFETLEGTVKNLVIDSVNIASHSGNTGAIACTAQSAARVYNVGILSGSVGGTDNTGGLVGQLSGTARVVNCYSYATITGGTTVGGIVGYNNQNTTAANNNQKTMVFACMFYGDITGGTTISPVYGGTTISNAGSNTTSGVSNFNYFRLEAPYVQPTGVTFNCALGAEDRFLKRFEFYRHILNGQRQLAGWWATGTYSKDDMLKWVLLPDSLGTHHPYPILMQQGKYPSVVNLDAANAQVGKPRNQGGKLGELAVHIQMGSGGAVYGAPAGAAINTADTTLIITDKDTAHYNFNYYKVQLPYYNEVGTKNYNGNRVVTGWKIVSITGGTPGAFTTGDDAPAYNFADRNCTNKDLYGTGGSNRIFNQGAYWDVPEGVTAITIEPYWAKCVYLADPNADKVYNTAMETGYDVANVGGGVIYTNGNSYSIAGDNQLVYTSMGNAISSSNSTGLFVGVVGNPNNQSVYDYAVVLVGNYHHLNSIEASKAKPYTVTSIDLDGDNEPDYSYMLRFNGRTECHPLRVDFINIPGLGMAQKSTGGTGSYNFGILIPKGWYESTNTSLLRFTQFEYENQTRSATDALIVQGGVMEQWVSYNQKGRSNKIPYIHVGGNVWFKEFHTGCHQDKNQLNGDKRFQPTKHSPISVTGGDFDEFYLTGLYVANAGLDNYADNAECYINGGHFGTVCGAAMEGIGKANGDDNTGNITWLIQNADIREFYAGGLNAAKPVTGNLSTTIIDSYVDLFCGGPKFGDMSSGKTVVTDATGCTFGTFFGAGYGGNSYSRYAPSNQNNVTNINWNNWLNSNYSRSYNATYGGVSTRFSYQFLPMSDNKTNVARILIDFVKFSLATTRNVTSTLTNCTVTSNFYGGGSLGKVEGNVTSTLDSCTVQGNVFGAGFSASLPTVEVDAIGFLTEPYYYSELGTYRTGVKGQTTTYTWEHGNAISVDNTNHILYTTENLNTLGTVTGEVSLTLKGNTTVGTLDGSNQLVEGSGNVFGGGEESAVSGNSSSKTTVSLQEGANILGNVYGGGNEGLVSGDSKVELQDPTPQAQHVTVGGHVFGGGNKANVGGSSTVLVDQAGAAIANDVYGGGAKAHVNSSDGSAATAGKSTHVTLKQGTVGGDVYGGGLGYLRADDSEQDTAANVFGPVTVTINGGTVTNSVFGCNNLYGAPQSTVTVDITQTESSMTLHNVYGGGNLAAYSAPAAPDHDYPEVNINHGTVGGSVFGGGYGASAIVSGNPKVTVGDADNTHTATVSGNVYGGGDLAAVTGSPHVILQNANTSIAHEVYGGGNQANVENSTTIDMLDGTVSENIYGGGALADVGTSASDNTTVNILGGTVSGNVYGGGLGRKAATGVAAVAAAVNGVVTVNIGALGSTDPVTGFATSVSGDAIIGGSVFGCNNTNGTPTDDVTVNIYQTHRETSQQVSGSGYALTQVFGGGNEAHYQPTSANKTATVHIWTCDNTIQYVYGGGNAANVGTDGGVEGATEVIIDGGRIDWVFGGGNGAGAGNPGANIYGDTKVTFHAGDLTYIFGGSNEKGNVSGSKTVDILSDGTCSYDNHIAELYGGSNMAPTTGDVSLTMGCSTNPCDIGALFGGSRDADITGSVTLTIEGGSYAEVFGGNNQGGTIHGDVTLNLLGGTIGNAFGGNNAGGFVNGKISVNMLDKEDASCPLVVNNIYGGGKNAAYTPTTPGAYPEVNLINGSVTQDAGDGGNVYGGGYGADAVVTSTPTVNVGYDDATMAALASNLKGSALTTSSVAVAGNVFGGGEAAPVTGNTNVTLQQVVSGVTASTTVSGSVFGGGDVANVSGNTDVDINGGTVTQNVFGGGNLANVAGNTDVDVNGGIVTLDVYGGGALADVGTSSSNHTHVTIAGGTVSRGVYGGGLGDNSHEALVKGAVQVTVNSGSVNDVFGCNNVNGHPTSTVRVDINNNVGGNVYGGGNLAAYTGNPEVYVNNGTVSGSVYGGGNGDPNDNTAETAMVTGNPQVTVGDGIGSHYAVVAGNVYGGGNAAKVTGNTTVTYNDNHASSQVSKLFGGGNAAGVTGTAEVAMTQGKVTAGIYGGCNAEGSVEGAINVYVKGGTLGVSGTPMTEGIFGGGYGQNTETGDNVTVTIGYQSTTPTIWGDVYGGSSFGSVNNAISEKTTVNFLGGTLHGDLFGGGKGQIGGTSIAAVNNGQVEVNIVSNNGGNYTTGVYGGANINGTVKGAIDVNVSGNVGVADTRRDIFGGGLGAATQTEGDVTVTVGDQAGTTAPAIFGDVYGGSSLGSVNNDAADKTTVDILSGSLTGNVYGGGMGEVGAANAAKGQVNGEVEVNIGKKEGNNYYGSASFHTYQVVSDTKGGGIFGCNNTNGSPKDNVTVNIYATAHGADAAHNLYPTGITTAEELATNAATQTYAIKGVFGGGNLASYEPVAGKSTTVHVYNCNNTIQDIFGGSNAANVGTSAIPANTFIIIDGGRIHRVFGGGNGDPTPANIYGTATTSIHAGLIDQIFGCGNLLGSITESNLNIDKSGSCSDEVIREVFGGANMAPLTGTVNTSIVCGVGVIDEVYGGSNKATITGDVTLNLHGGTYNYVYGGSKGVADDPATPGDEGVAANIDGNVTLNLFGGTVSTAAFGGSNANGNISGTISVNVLDYETPSCGLDINNLYGAGNLTAYAPSDATLNSPLVNVMHIGKTQGIRGNVYGGGKGASATVTSYPQVNIGYDATTLVSGSTTMSDFITALGDYPAASSLTSYPRAYVTGDIFGGGDEAATEGTASVLMQNASSHVHDIFGGGNQAAVGATSVTIIDGEATHVYGGGNDVATGGVGNTTTVAVSGGTITQGLYGGCNTRGTVTGNVTVNVTGGTIGTDDAISDDGIFGGGYGQNTLTSADVNVTINGASAVVYGDVYGGSALGNVNGTAVNTTNHTHVTLSNGTIHGDLYGGGLGQTSPAAIAAMVYSPVQVTVDGGIVENVYGCNNFNGAPQSTVQVTVAGGTVNQSLFGGGNQADYSAGTPLVTVTSGEVKERIIGGGNAANVTGNTHIVIQGGTFGTGTGASRGVYGGCNMSGTVGGNAVVDILGGTFGTEAALNEATPQPYNIHGGGYGSITVVSGNVTVNYGADDGTTAASAYPKLYGDLYGGSALGVVNTNAGNTTSVNVLNGSFGYKDKDMGAQGAVQYGGNIYGGGLGDATGNHPAEVRGVVHVNIGAATVDPATTPTGKADLRHCNVYGCNNAFGSPQEDVYVDVYQTAHTATDMADYEPLPGQPDPTFAIQNVFGGGNNAHYAPTTNPLDSDGLPTKRVHNTIHYCNNTIENVYGGGNAANVIRAKIDIDGGRYKFIFAGGNGQITAANVGVGGVDINIKSGRVGWYFEGCNMHGSIANGAANSVRATNGCTVGVDCPCEQTDLIIENYYFGANMATIYGGLHHSVVCGGEKFEYKRVYAGSRLAIVYGDIELTVRGGKIGNLFGGCEGSSLISADVRKYPSDWLDHRNDGTYDPDLIHFMDSVYAGGSGENLAGKGGNITLRLEGGKLGNVYGGCDYRGNVEGNIRIIVDSSSVEREECRLDIDYIYGGNNLARYAPDGATPSDSRISPLIELKNGHVNYAVYGGSKGGDPSHLFGNGEVISNPKVIVGDGELGHAFRIGFIDQTDPANPVTYGDLFGGGSSANVKGNTEVILQGTVDAGGKSSTVIEHNVYGGGKSGDVDGNTKITVVP